MTRRELWRGQIISLLFWLKSKFITLLSCLKRQFFTLLSFSLVVGAGLLVYNYYPITTLEPITAESAETINFLELVVPAVFSAVLAILYLRMSGTQRRQTEIQDIQTKLQEAEQKPIINVHSLDATADSVLIELENVGSGTAENISIVAHIYINGLDAERAIKEPLHRNFLVREGSDPFIRSIGSGQKSRFSGRVYLPSKQYDGFDETFSSGLESAFEGISTDTFYLQFELQYEHNIPNKKRARQFITPLRASASRGYTLEDVIKGGTSAPEELRTILQSNDSSLREPTVLNL